MGFGLKRIGNGVGRDHHLRRELLKHLCLLPLLEKLSGLLVDLRLVHLSEVLSPLFVCEPNVDQMRV